MRGRQQLFRIEDDVVAGDGYARHVGGVHKIGEFDVNGTQQSLDGNLENRDMLHVQTHQTIGGCGKRADNFDR